MTILTMPCGWGTLPRSVTKSAGLIASAGGNTAPLSPATWWRINSMTRFWLWIALAAAGQAAALRLIDAGPRIHFQHYFAADLPLVAVFVIVIQMVFVVVAISARLPSVLGLLRSRLGSWP